MNDEKSRQFKLLKELPDVSKGTMFMASGKDGWYYNESVNKEHYMRSLPFYIVENRPDWFEEKK